MLDSLSTPKSLVDQAYERILDALSDGTFKSGERLTQEDIATRLNVSRQPVTHALAVLKAQGFLVPSGKRGLVVTDVDPALLTAIYQVRSAIEPLAVRLATKRMTKSAIRRGRALVEHGRKMAVANDSKATLQADMDFHSLIYELSGNPIIEETMRLHWRHLRRGMAEVHSHPGMLLTVWKEHGLIFERMISGDGETAAELVHNHLIGAYERRLNLTADPGKVVVT